MTPSIVRIGAQALGYAAFAAAIGPLSQWPAYMHDAPGSAALTLSFSHAGQPVSDCRKLTQEELDKLAPNMRRPVSCPRRRVPLVIELDFDGVPIYRDELAPSGLAGDGAATAYRRLPIEPGSHHVVARLRDSRRTEGFDWRFERDLTIRSGQHVVIDFRPNTGGFRVL